MNDGTKVDTSALLTCDGIHSAFSKVYAYLRMLMILSKLLWARVLVGGNCCQIWK